LSYEIADARNAKKDVAGQQNGDAREKRFILEPNSFEAFTYLYSFTGLFTGIFRLFCSIDKTDYMVKWQVSHFPLNDRGFDPPEGKFFCPIQKSC
jgi:hypothetical protein